MKNKKRRFKTLYIFILSLVTILPCKAFALSFSDIGDAISGSVRRTFISIDKAIYEFAGKIYELFFDMTKLNFLTGDIYSTIFKRVFLILGIFMLFKLIFSMIGYLVSPDSLNDKEKGANKLIGRVISCVLLLIVLVPYGPNNSNVKVKNEDFAASTRLNANISEQGIAFGTLQTLQELIVEKEIIGKIILGSAASNYTNNTNMGNDIALTIFSTFFRRNKDLTIDECAYAISSENVKIYKFDDNDDNAEYIVNSMDEAYNLADVTCDDANNSYLFTYDVFISTIVGIVLVVLIFLFTFDVALRGIKLGILRLIAPIPAISYISPKSAKDGAFANYIKTLMSTYLDLFLRLAIIYIVVLLISAIAGDNTQIIEGTTNGVGKVIIIITLLFFAGQAPKFIMQALGIKSKGTGLGFGAALLGGALTGAMAGAATGGIWGAAKGLVGGAAAGSSNQWAAQNGQRQNMSAAQAARAKGAQLGLAKVDPEKSGLLSRIGGVMTNRALGLTQGRIDQLQGEINDANVDHSLLSAAAINQNVLTERDAHGNYVMSDTMLARYGLTRTASSAELNQKAAQLQNKINKNQAYLDSVKKERDARNTYTASQNKVGATHHLEGKKDRNSLWKI